MSSIQWFLTPYDFYPAVLFASCLAMAWYIFGLVRFTKDAPAPRGWRIGAYVVGVVLMYAVLQTRIDFWSQHLFCIHRMHQFALHDLAPFLIMVAAPGRILVAALPKRLRGSVGHWTGTPVPRLILRIALDPVLAVGLFAGLAVLWAIPPVHFYTMLSARLYAVMNWSTAISGLIFWGLILDPRSPTRTQAPGYGVRIAALAVAMATQGAVSAAIGLSTTNLYPIYAVCGRLWPLGPMTDQRLGGMVGMLAATICIAGLLTVFYRMLDEQSVRPRAQAGGERNPANPGTHGPMRQTRRPVGSGGTRLAILPYHTE